MKGRTIKVVLADDHVLVRAGIKALLDTLPQVDVIAETGDGLEVLNLVRTNPPDILLLDITLPGLNGLEVAQQLTKKNYPTKIVMLSMHAGAEYVARALNAGAAGYLVKESAVTELSDALDNVMKGKRYLSQTIDPEVVNGFQASVSKSNDSLAILTPRQRQILQLVAEGQSTRDIAAKLNVSIKTVETHRAQLMDRLGIHEVAGLVRFAIRHQLVDPQH